MEDLPKGPKTAGLLVVLARMSRGEIMRNNLRATALILLSGCTTAALASENPWYTPSRVSNPSLGIEDSELVALMKPCIDYARDSFAEAARRVESDLPPEASFSVTGPLHLDGGKGLFFVYVDSIDSTRIHGRIANSGVYPDGRGYSRGDEYSLATMDIVDWTIGYPDRPEEGNLLGKYLLLLQDGLVSGPCDPQHDEFKHFRLFLENISFVPPSGVEWRMRGRHASWQMTMAKQSDSPGELHAFYSSRTPECALCAAGQDLLTTLSELFGKEDAAGPKGYKSTKQELTAYTKKEAECVLIHLLSENRRARLSPSRKKGLVIREEWEIGYIHPQHEKELITIGYIHHYQPEQKDPEFSEKAHHVFQSLAFTEPRDLTLMAAAQGKEDAE